MAISSWKKAISDKPTIFTENKNGTYIDWFSIGYQLSPVLGEAAKGEKAYLTTLFFATKVLWNLD